MMQRTIVLILIIKLTAFATELPQLGPAPQVVESLTVMPSAPAAPAAVTNGGVDIADADAVGLFYQQEYQASEGVPINWSGSITGNNPGTTSVAYLEATLRRVNYFRAMAQLPGTVYSHSSTTSQWCQESALMMAANHSLSHSPPPTWSCFTATGSNAASKSNLALGTAGPAAINLYLQDSGTGNQAVGHRRWVLYPRARVMGTGSVNSGAGWNEIANDLWVLTDFGARPAAPQWVSWPPPGYCPYQLFYARWSFSYYNANFASASVTMRTNGAPLALTVVSRTDNGYGDNTIIWEPVMTSVPLAATPLAVNVCVSNVLINGGSSNFCYTATAIDPASVPEPSIGWLVFGASLAACVPRRRRPAWLPSTSRRRVSAFLT